MWSASRTIRASWRPMELPSGRRCRRCRCAPRVDQPRLHPGRSPCRGKIGRGSRDRGAYVQQGPRPPCHVRSSSIYVDLTQSSDELRRLRERIDSGEIRSSRGEVSATVVVRGRKRVSAQRESSSSPTSTVDQGTGSVVLRAIVANPGARCFRDVPARAPRARVTLERSWSPRRRWRAKSDRGGDCDGRRP